MNLFVCATRICLVFLIACRVVELMSGASMGRAFSTIGVLLLVLAVLGVEQATAAHSAPVAERSAFSRDSVDRPRRLRGRARRMR